MTVIAIVAGGPSINVPNLTPYVEEVSEWIGADYGALTLINEGIVPDLAIGDFDSISDHQNEVVKSSSITYDKFPSEKDETDLELAISKAIKKKPDKILLFGVTGGRMDHGMVNIQLLYKLIEENIRGIIIDKSNWIEMYKPGTYRIEEGIYTNISFLPFSKQVIGITLEGFYYNLSNRDISWGSTLCISNKLISKKGTFYFEKGILLVIKSRDVLI